jgi:hypothetical protein
MKPGLGALVGGVILLASTSARAGGPDFGYVYTAETEEAGETEVSLWATDRNGKDQGHYDAQDYRIEVERGVTDRLQVAGYVNFAGHHIRNVGGEFERVDRDIAFQGLSAEFIYQLAAPSGKKARRRTNLSWR